MFVTLIAANTVPLLATASRTPVLSWFDMIQHWAPLITLVSALAASTAAFASWRSSNASRKTYDASLYLNFSERYNSEDMYEALKLLTDYYKRNHKTFKSRWKNDIATRDPEIEHINVALRRVGRYYFDIARLYKSGFVTKGIAADMCRQGGINVFYEVWIPMSQISKPNMERYQDDIKTLRGILRRYHDGKII